MEDYLRIGVLTSPHGVKGEISVYPTSEDLDRYSDLTDCFLLIKGKMKPVKVTGCKYKKNMPVLKFEGIDDRDAIEALRGTELYVDREHALELDEGEYYLADIMGFKVSADNVIIGSIEDYFENAADQTIFVVKCNDGTTKYIPDIEEFVLDVNMDEELVYVKLIKGM
jgi:16S rRNA processing protein RimM